MFTLIFFWITVGILELRLKKVIKLPSMVIIVVLQLLQCLVLRWITQGLTFQQLIGGLTLVAYWVGTRMCVVGLTGGIACGKTTVCEQLKQHGFHIVDCDKINHNLLAND